MAESKSNLHSDEVFGCKPINPAYCESCIFCEVRKPFGKLPRIGNCQIYTPPDSKPEAVLFDGAECEYYEREKPNTRK